MTNLVQTINGAVNTCFIVDNTGIKNVVTEPMLKLFQVNRFPSTYHADLKSAARVALKIGIANAITNELLSSFVRDNLGENKWTLVSTLTSQ